jgi:DNA polymerase-3 subunit alpha
MVVRKVMSLAEARAARSRGLELKLDGARLGARFGQDLQQRLGSHRPAQGATGCPVRVRYRNSQREGVLRLGEGWRVAAPDELLKRLRQQFGAEAVEVLY